MEFSAQGRTTILKERLQKIISHAGICSRRKAELLIQEGQVKVNGKVVRELGTEADLKRDKIKVKGELIHQEKPRYFLFNKPDCVITSVSDPVGRRTVIQYFPNVRERIFPVGRLDYHSEGLLLMTNDGNLDYLLTHPSKGVEKVYEVTVRGKFSQTLADNMSRGVKLKDGTRTAPCKVKVLSYESDRNRTHIQMTLHEGKNREIRRMMEVFHYPVFKLERVKYSFLTLKGVPRGEFRRLTSEEVKKLYELHQ